MTDRVDLQPFAAESAAQLVEVLPRDEYDEEHLPGAIHLPLRELDAAAVSVLERGRTRDRLLLGRTLRHEPSSRVAARAARLRRGLRLRRREGRLDRGRPPTMRLPTAERRAIEAIDPHPPIARLGERAADVVESSTRNALAVDDAGVVLGRVNPERMHAEPDALVESLMSLGPTTVRAHEPLDPLRERMRSRDVGETIVTNPEGILLGVVDDDGVERLPPR